MMSKLANTLSTSIVTVTLVVGTSFTPTQVLAATDVDAAALRQATMTCKAQVKEQAKFHDMSWFAQHEAVKNCVRETLARH